MKKIYILISITLLIISFKLIINHKTFNEKPNNKSKNSTKKYDICKNYEYYSWQLNDSIHNYLERSYLNGIKKTLNNPNEISPYILKGELKQIQNNKYYIIDSLKHSYPFLIPNAEKLLNIIAVNFQKKLVNTNLKGIRLIVTSVLRTSTTIKQLRRRNRNAIRYSAHLHGTTFDIDYYEYNHKNKITITEREILRDILAKTLYDLRKKEKCWVTYEKYQTCFHIVSREKST